MVEELPAPRTAYEGHERHTPWNDLQYLYFIGYAFWNYFTTPFLLTLDGVICEEIEPWRRNHQKWRVLRATFDPSIDTHLQCRNSISTAVACCSATTTSPDVAKGNVAHYCMDYKTFDGFVFPDAPTGRFTRGRRVHCDRWSLECLARHESVVVSRD